MVQFPRKKQQDGTAADKSVSGSTFLKEARGRLSAVIEQYALEDQHDMFDSVEELLAALEPELWREAEKLLKESYRNGSRGRGKSR